MNSVLNDLEVFKINSFKAKIKKKVKNSKI